MAFGSAGGPLPAPPCIGLPTTQRAFSGTYRTTCGRTHPPVLEDASLGQFSAPRLDRLPHGPAGRRRRCHRTRHARQRITDHPRPSCPDATKLRPRHRAWSPQFTRATRRNSASSRPRPSPRCSDLSPAEVPSRGSNPSRPQFRQSSRSDVPMQCEGPTVTAHLAATVGFGQDDQSIPLLGAASARFPFLTTEPSLLVSISTAKSCCADSTIE